MDPELGHAHWSTFISGEKKPQKTKTKTNQKKHKNKLLRYRLKYQIVDKSANYSGYFTLKCKKKEKRFDWPHIKCGGCSK